jgi:hypothetical protein
MYQDSREHRATRRCRRLAAHRDVKAFYEALEKGNIPN